MTRDFSSLLKNLRWWAAAAGTAAFTAAVALPPGLGLSRSGQNAVAVALLMALFWIGEVIPIYATALMPLVMFPLLGVLDPKAASAPYADRVVFLMMGGFMLAEAMKKWGLHRRIALHVIRLLGRSPAGVVGGFMLATAGLSMWMSNSATAVMMVPIAVSVIWRLQGAAGPDEIRPDPLSSALMLAIAYSASIGGIATLVGTPPNAIFAGQVKALFPEAPEIFFEQWIKLGLPLSLALLFIAWVLLTRVLFPLHKLPAVVDRTPIKEELTRLGPMSRGEMVALSVFTITGLAWMTLGLWSKHLPAGASVHDSTVAMAAALALFLIPVHWQEGSFALDWEDARKIPWGVLALFGGGFSLAAGLHQSGAAAWVGDNLSLFKGAPVLVLILAVCLMITFLTEVTSNSATATIMMPIMAMTAVASGIHPFLLMLPATLSASCAFMLPAATPPNAIVFGSGLIRLPQMARAGLVLNLVGAILVTGFVYYLAGWAFGMDLASFPAWAEVK